VASFFFGFLLFPFFSRAKLMNYKSIPQTSGTSYMQLGVRFKSAEASITRAFIKATEGSVADGSSDHSLSLPFSAPEPARPFLLFVIFFLLFWRLGRPVKRTWPSDFSSQDGTLWRAIH
jgi:hypothetical protein